MKNKIIIALLIVLLPSVLISSSFYKNLAEEGKKFYMAGKYEEAVENFRIAEFGLMENKELLKEVYFYYSLAHFKLSNGDEVVELADKLKELEEVSKFEDLELPAEIQEDLDTMFSAIDKTYKKAVEEKTQERTGKVKKNDRVKKENYMEVYDGIRNSITDNNLAAVKSGLRKLKKLRKTDIRTRHISGIIYFRENKYKKAIIELILVSKTGSDELKDEASYFLALSNYFLKNHGQFLAFAQKVKDTNTKGKLSDILRKVKKIREEGISDIKENFFSKRNFNKFADSFNGDISLSSDILDEISKLIPVRIKDIYYMADSALKYPGIYNRDFILRIADLFVESEEDKFAINIIRGSKFFKEGSKSNIEILYKLGMIYNDIGKKKKMKKIMLRVKKINPDYKKVNYYLTNEKS